MTSPVNYYRIASDCHSSNACDVGGSLCSCCADADGIGFASNTKVANIDIVIACGKVGTGGIAQRNIAAAGRIVIKCPSTVGCVLDAGRITEEHAVTGGCVAAGGCVVKERKSTVGCVIVAGGVVLKRNRADGCVAVAGCIELKRMSPDGCVGAAIDIVLERKRTDGRVVAADCGAIQRRITDRGITEARRQTEEGISTLSSGEVPIASARWRRNRSNCRRKRKAAECERGKNQGGGRTCNRAREHSCSRPVNLNSDCCFHNDYCFLFGLSLSGSCLSVAIHSRKIGTKFPKFF
jgi:hypothetical protein